MIKILKMILKKELITLLLVIILGITIYRIIKSLMNKYLRIRNLELRREKTMISIFNNILKYTLLIFAVLIVLDSFGVDTKGIIASLGVVGLVIGLSLQDIIKDFIAGIFIILENQYAIGDIVTIAGFKGEVISLGLKTTKIKSYTGEINTISNRSVEKTINHSLNNQKLIVDFQIPADYDIQGVLDLLEVECEKLSKKLKTIKGKVNLIGVNGFTHLATEFRIEVETIPLSEIEVKSQILLSANKTIQKNKEKLLTKS